MNGNTMMDDPKRIVATANILPTHLFCTYFSSKQYYLLAFVWVGASIFSLFYFSFLLFENALRSCRFRWNVELWRVRLHLTTKWPHTPSPPPIHIPHPSMSLISAIELKSYYIWVTVATPERQSRGKTMLSVSFGNCLGGLPNSTASHVPHKTTEQTHGRQITSTHTHKRIRIQSTAELKDREYKRLNHAQNSLSQPCKCHKSHTYVCFLFFSFVFVRFLSGAFQVIGIYMLILALHSKMIF